MRQAIERLIHDPSRFRFLMAIAHARGRALFVDIADELGAPKNGALAYHGRLLAKAGLVSMKKRFAGSVPQTWFSLTPEGRRVLADLTAELDAAISEPGELA